MSGACIYLGDLTIEQIEREHDFRFTDEERELLRKTHHEKAHFMDGESGWHMFDVPPALVISNGPIGHKALDVFMAHNSDYKYQFPGAYGNKTEEVIE